MAHGARRAAPECVFGLPKKLAHRDVSISLRLAQATRHPQRIGEGPGAKARRCGSNPEAGHFKRSALTLEQVARRREGRVLIAGRRGHAIDMKTGLGLRRSADEVGRCRPTPKPCDAVQRGAFVLYAWPATDQRDQIVGVFAAGAQTNHRAHRVRDVPWAKEAIEQAAAEVAQRLAGAAENAMRPHRPHRPHRLLPTTSAELASAGIISEIGTCQ